MLYNYYLLYNMIIIDIIINDIIIFDFQKKIGNMPCLLAFAIFIKKLIIKTPWNMQNA